MISTKLSPFIRDLEEDENRNSQIVSVSNLSTRIGCDKLLFISESNNKRISEKEKYPGKVFLGYRIVKFCWKYRLRLLPTYKVLVNLLSLDLDHEIDFLEKCSGKKCSPDNFFVCTPYFFDIKNVAEKRKMPETNIINEFALFYLLGNKQFYLLNRFTCGIKYPTFSQKMMFWCNEWYPSDAYGAEVPYEKFEEFKI